MSSGEKYGKYPEQGELVLGTVTNIFRQGAFITLDEYGNKKGMLHLSEISLKWVRNIRDYVKENQKVVLSVIRVNPERGHIDLSLRRVKDHDRKEKLKEVKQNQRVAKLFEMLSKKVGKDKSELDKEVSQKILTKFETVYEGLDAILADKNIIKELKISKGLQKPLFELIEKSITSTSVEIAGYLKLISYEPNGVELIKKTLGIIENYNLSNNKSKDYNKIEKVSVISVSPPIYSIKVKAHNYKIAEKFLRKSTDEGIKFIKKNHGIGEFHRKQEELS